MYPIILSGCSGGGKSTLLDALAKRGYAVFPEAGRRVVQDALSGENDGLPWINPQRFVELATDYAAEDYRQARQLREPVFLDRSILDLYIYLVSNQLALPDNLATAFARQTFHNLVFMMPPWADIYERDAERQKDFSEAVIEFDALIKGYTDLGYNLEIVAKNSVEVRADFIEEMLGLPHSQRDMT